MKNIDSYIIEKLHLNKDIDVMDDDTKVAYDYLVKLFNEEQVHYTIEKYGDNNIKVIITDKDLLDKKKADRYVGNINTTLHANKINYRALYPTINKQGNRKTSITIFFYNKDEKH